MEKICMLATLILTMIFSFATPVFAIDLSTEFMSGSYPRFYVVEKDGKESMAGMCIDIMHALEKKVPEIKFTYKIGLVPFARIKELLKRSMMDAAFGVARNPAREKVYVYTDTPLYPTRFVIFALKSDKKAHGIKSFKDIEAHGGTMLGLRGTNAIKVFQDKTKHLNIRTEVAPTMVQNIRMVLLGRGAFFTYNDIDAIGALKKDGSFDKFFILPLVTKNTHHWLAFSQKVPKDIVAKANKGLKDMNDSGELKRIYDSYVSDNQI